MSLYKIASNTLLSKFDTVNHSAIRFVTKAPNTTPHCELNDLVGWSSLHIRCQIHWLQVIYKSLLGKSPPYLSSLVTIATATRRTRSSRYISLVIPKANSSFGCLSFQFSAANDWNELQKSQKLETYTSLTNFKHRLSEQLFRSLQLYTAHSTNYLPHPCVYIFFSTLLHTSISTCTSTSAHLSLWC